MKNFWFCNTTENLSKNQEHWIKLFVPDLIHIRNSLLGRQSLVKILKGQRMTLNTSFSIAPTNTDQDCNNPHKDMPVTTLIRIWLTKDIPHWVMQCFPNLVPKFFASYTTCSDLLYGSLKILEACLAFTIFVAHE